MINNHPLPFRIAVAAILLTVQLISPILLFPQSGQSYRDHDSWGASQRILDYQFDRADRELSPDRWMQEARQGIMVAKSVMADMIPDFFNNPEAQAEFAEWSEQELENRFTKWLLERFFGSGVEIPAAAVYRETSEADKYLIYFTSSDGDIVYDPTTGDPKIIRPDDEEHNYNEDLLAWKQITEEVAEREIWNYSTAIKESYIELLMYISPERALEFEKMLAAAGERAVSALKREFEAILAREERYFTAQRLGDVWSLRKKSEDQSAEAIGEKLIQEARQACADGIALIQAKIESAKAEGADVALSGMDWLEEYQRQFQRGLDAWTAAEESFLIRLMEWELSAENAFNEGRETWLAVLTKFEEERKNWEEEARLLFLEGEHYFADISETLEAAIAAAKSEFENGSQIRVEAASQQVQAIMNMYILSSSATEEAKNNIDFWIGKYREIKPGVFIPSEENEFQEWLENEILIYGTASNSLEGFILEELKEWSLLYSNYVAKSEESFEQLIKELYSITGSYNDSENIYYPDSYEIELIRAVGEVEYWQYRTALQQAVVAYAEALDAGRTTASESAEAWEKARIAYNEALEQYNKAESLLSAAGTTLSSERDALVKAAEAMRDASAEIEKLRQEYQDLLAASGNQASTVIASDLVYLYQILELDQGLLATTDENSLWGKFLISARDLEEQEIEEIRKQIIMELILGYDDDFISLARLAINAKNSDYSIDENIIYFVEALLAAEKINQGQYNYLYSLLSENYSAQAETQLEERLAMLSLVIEENSITSWYRSVYSTEGEAKVEILFNLMEDQLLYDWEGDTLALLKARALLELEALEFLEGNKTSEAAAILAALYSGDEEKLSSDKEILKTILALLNSFIEDRAKDNSIGNLAEFLEEISRYDERIFFFLSGTSLINQQYGQTIIEILLNDYFCREEFSGNLYNMYLSLAAFSPAAAKEEIENGIFLLEKFLDTLGLEISIYIFPDTITLLSALEKIYGDSYSGISSMLSIVEEIFNLFPSWFNISTGIWKESIINYFNSPSAETLAEAERYTNYLNAALLLLYDQKVENSGYLVQISNYLINSLLEWNKSIFSLEDINYNLYEAAYEELSYTLSREKYVKDEIARLSELAAVSKQNLESKESDIASAIALKVLAEEKYDELLSAYQKAADNFKKAGETYDNLFYYLEIEFKNLQEARKVFETQDAIRLWAETAYLDSSSPINELKYYQERAERAIEALAMLESLDLSCSYSLEYDDALKSYQDSLSLYTLSLDALSHLEKYIQDEQERNELAYLAYQEQLALLGQAFYLEDDYVSPEDKSLWNILDMITIENGYLVFSMDDSYVLSGSNEEIAQMLNEYFLQDKVNGDDPYLVSSFELALQELSSRLMALNLTMEGYQNLALARDYLLRLIMENNPDLGGTENWYRDGDALSQSSNAGNMIINPGNNEKVYQVTNQAREETEKNQQLAWESLDEETKKDLEFYVILTLMGGGGINFDNFSYVSDYQIYSYVLNVSNKNNNSYKKKANIFLIGLFYQNSYKITKATTKAITTVFDKVNSLVNEGYNGFVETITLLEQKLALYKESTETLLALKSESDQAISWADIELSLSFVDDFDEDLSSLKELWDQLMSLGAVEIYNVHDALIILNEYSGKLKDESKANLYQVWENGNSEKESNESIYKKLYNDYIEGKAELKDLEAAAISAFACSVPSEKYFLENIGSTIIDTLIKFTERGMGGTAEHSILANELTEIITKAWEGKYASELKIRENEYELQLRDIQEKYAQWRESVETILERGRIAWKEAGENIQAAYNTWVKSFQEEYQRIKDQWTAAYLEGLSDKEAWAAFTLEAASDASSAAVLAMIGSSAEAGARAMDTRDPLGFLNVPDIKEGERILANLLEQSGIGNLSDIFGSILASRETFATTVRSGISGGSIWNYGSAQAEAEIFANTVREEFETRESRKMAFTVLESAKEAYLMMEKKLGQANDEFRKSMDEMFVIDAQWRRSGSRYIKDVIVHSTLFNSVITEYAEVEGYLNYTLPQTRLSSYLYDELPENLNTYQAELFIDSIYSELIELNYFVFGSATSGGDFNIYLGNVPSIKAQPNPDKGRSGVFDDQGSGELGRLLTEWYFWNFKEQTGVAMVAMAPWDKPMWDSRDSSLQSPSLRSAINLVVQTGVVIAGATGALFTGGASLIGSIALSAAINSADDLLFSVLDVVGGYKTWDEAGFEFGKQLLINTASAAVSSVFYGVSGMDSSTFLGSGGFSGLVSNTGIGGVAFKTLTTGLYSFTSGTVTSALSSVTYSSSSGLGFSGDSFLQGLKNSGISAVSAMTGTLTSSILDMGLKGFVNELGGKGLYDNGLKLNQLTGGLASQAVNYAFGNDFTLNILNVGMFFGQDVNAGILELHLGRDGIGLELGSNGVDVSIGTLVKAAKGLETWKVNAQLLLSKEEATSKYASELRTLYSKGGVELDEYYNVLAGLTKYVERSDVSWTESIYDYATGIKTVYLGSDALNDGSAFGLNVIFSHEAYRDGIDKTDDAFRTERDNAVLGHMNTALTILNTYGYGSLGEWMTMGAEAYAGYLATGNADIIQIIMDSYDASGNFWKLLPNGNLAYDGLATLSDSEGREIRSAASMGLKETQIETALVTILGLDPSDPEDVKWVRNLMNFSGLVHSYDEDPEQWYWYGVHEAQIRIGNYQYAISTHDLAEINMNKEITLSAISNMYQLMNADASSIESFIMKTYGSAIDLLNHSDTISTQWMLSAIYTKDQLEKIMVNKDYYNKAKANGIDVEGMLPGTVKKTQSFGEDSGVIKLSGKPPVTDAAYFWEIHTGGDYTAEEGLINVPGGYWQFYNGYSHKAYFELYGSTLRMQIQHISYTEIASLVRNTIYGGSNTAILNYPDAIYGASSGIHVHVDMTLRLPYKNRYERQFVDSDTLLPGNRLEYSYSYLDANKEYLPGYPAYFNRKY